MVATLSGCATTPYPANWAAVDTPSEKRECEVIAGTFSQRGREGREPLFGKSSEREALLASVLFPPPQPALVTHVTLRLSADAPSIEAWLGEELLARAVPRKGELNCEAGAWRLEGSWSYAGGGVGVVIPAAGATRALREFRLASDGALVVKETERLAGVVALVPVYMSAQAWYRFPVATRADREPGPDAPRGVLSPDTPYARLLPPETLRAAGRNEQHRVSSQCLQDALAQAAAQGARSQAANSQAAPPGRDARLAGKPVQGFLVQGRAGAPPVLRRQWLNRASDHVPSTKTSRLAKPHWLDPRVAERTVSCLLDAGYVWDIASAPAESRFDYSER